jgi:hypothetical protein
MSFNLIDLIKDQLSDQVMNQVGSMLGGDSSQLNSAVGSAIPGLLSGLMNLGSDSTSANAMATAINDQDDSILDNLGDLLSSGDSQDSLLGTGSKVLSSLLGDSALGTLASTIAGFSGLGKGSSKSLLGLLVPVIFSVIKRKLLGSGGFNVGSLLDMFSGQKENITAAMPAGFDQQLQASGFTSNFSSTVNEVTEKISDGVEEVASSGSSWLARLIPLALLIGAMWFLYNQFTQSEIEIPETPVPVVNTDVAPVPNVVVPKTQVVEPTTNIIEPAASIVIPGTNIKEELSVILGSVTNSLGSITDVASAEQAVPQLGVATEKLGGLANMVAKLPEAAKLPVQQIISGGVPQIQAMIDKVSAIPGVGPILKPVADGLLQKLALFQ